MYATGKVLKPEIMAVHFDPVCGQLLMSNTSENSALPYLGFGQWYEFWYFQESFVPILIYSFLLASNMD